MGDGEIDHRSKSKNYSSWFFTSDMGSGEGGLL